MSEPARLTWLDAVRIKWWLRGIERPVVARDRAVAWLFLGSLALYWTIGQIFHQFHAHELDNLLFGGDTARVWADLTRSHRQHTSGIAVSSAHPLFIFFFHPPAALLARILAGADLLAALLICHSVAALGNVFLYLILRRCEVARGLAIATTIAFAGSTAQLVFGSTTETYTFIPAATLGLAWLALHTRSVWLASPFALLPFAINLTLLPYTLLCVPTVWFGRMRLRRWAPAVLGFWALVLVLGLGALLYQHVHYAETNFFDWGAFTAYDFYVHKPVFKERVIELGVHFFGFSVLGGKPMAHEGDAAREAGFIHNEYFTYSTVGWIAVAIWALLWLSASYGNLRGFLRSSGERRAVTVLCLGWLLGSFGLFCFYGWELFLPSEYWTAFLFLWVGLGLHALVSIHPHVRRPLAILGLIGIALLAANQGRFLMLLIRNYYDGPLFSLTRP